MYAKRIDIVKIKMIKEKTVKYADRKIRNPWDSYKVLKDFLENEDRETFIVMCLNTKNEPTNISVVSIGTLNSSFIHPREVFKTAILSNSCQILCAHNHPSGDIQPSGEDKKVTDRLKECGKLIGIDVIDHIIIGDGEYYNFKENKLL